ncbi:MAG: type 4a pilus biogenesis protein PilO [Armatimonadetes bacterium]|nr:type 4a pilus biogenesis protein PilO [Armatimonadota bacterium]NIO74864.1 type 4a pilus biogenesis protein PilO [Armatimonadota bacterium]NIO95626.1 type 4a pilus biogenesis protein PilO [Armatimonadota bacterium]
MINRSNRAALIALIGVFACVLIAAGAGLYQVKSKRLQSLRDSLAEKQGQIEEVRDEIRGLPALEASYEELDYQVSVLEPALPTEAYIPTFLSQIQTLAATSNNRLMLIKPKPKKKLPVAGPAPERDVVSQHGSGPGASGSPTPPGEMVSPYDEIGIEVGLEGTYWAALEFLQQLKAFPKMIAVNNLSMKPKSDCQAASSFEPILEVTVHLTAVLAKEN